MIREQLWCLGIFFSGFKMMCRGPPRLPTVVASRPKDACDLTQNFPGIYIWKTATAEAGGGGALVGHLVSVLSEPLH